MAQVLSGSVEYTRVRKDDDYGINRTAKVALTFQVEEGEDHATVAQSVGLDAVRIAHTLLAATPTQKAGAATPAAPPGATTAPPPSPAAPAPKPTQEEIVIAAGEAQKKRGRPPKIAQPDDGLGLPPALDRSPKAAEDDLADILGTAPTAVPVKTVTDAELGASITRKNAVLKKPDLIRALIKEFAGDPPKQSKDIPQTKREDFVKRLEALA